VRFLRLEASAQQNVTEFVTETDRRDLEKIHARIGNWRFAEMCVFSAKGAAFIVAWGSALGIVQR
jgi:hypothetical protein